MNTSYQKPLPLYTPGIDNQVIDLPVENMDAIAEDGDVFIEANNPEDSDSNLLSNVKYKILTNLQNHWKV